VLHGQPAGYLVAALEAYAGGRRRSGIMQPLATDLRAEDIRRLADYYAEMKPPRAEPRATDAALIEAGRKLAFDGAPDKGIMPCMACHSSASTTYPRIAGQHAAYMAGQLRLWRKGHVPATAGAALMAPMVKRMSDEEIDAATAYFSTVSPETVSTAPSAP
jgi:cytochrome c553